MFILMGEAVKKLYGQRASYIMPLAVADTLNPRALRRYIETIWPLICVVCWKELLG